MTDTSNTIVSADELHRGAKMALDTGEAASVEEAMALFRNYRIGASIDAETAATPAGQAALLTIVNCGRRSMLGGVHVAGALDIPLLLDLPDCGTRLHDAVIGLGGTVVNDLPATCPALILGEAPAAVPEPSLAVVYGGWRAGVVPSDEDCVFKNQADDVLAAMVAGATGVGEMFQNLRGNPIAGRRRQGLTLWDPGDLDWERAKPGPKSFVAPSHLWVIGLGHLGQAFLWALGLLPFANPGDVELTLQDFDALTKSNDSTSILTSLPLIGNKKTREMAAWSERRGLKVRIIERKFAGDVVLQADDPQIALCGVDNPQARAVLENAGFGLVVEAGLGAGPEEYCAMRIHAFPGASTAHQLWDDEGAVADSSRITEPAYRRMAEGGADECGLVTLASRTVGAPFVGTVAAGLVIAEVLRRLNAGPAFDVIDMTLRDSSFRICVGATKADPAFNPGYAELRAWPPA